MEVCSDSFLNRRFRDFDELTEAVRHWNLDFSQLDRGRFEGEVTQLIAGRVQFARARFFRKLEQSGSPPEGLRTFVIPADPEMPLPAVAHDILKWVGVGAVAIAVAGFGLNYLIASIGVAREENLRIARERRKSDGSANGRAL